jgi:hypothetical protein
VDAVEFEVAQLADAHPGGAGEQERVGTAGSVIPLASADLQAGSSLGHRAGRYLRVTPGRLLRTDAAKAKAKENLDGKYLLRTADLSTRPAGPVSSPT